MSFYLLITTKVKCLPRNIKKFTNCRWQIKDMKSPVLVVFATCFGTDMRGVWGKRGVMAVSSFSVIQAKWDCRYEEGKNYSDDMMVDLGVFTVTLPPSSHSIACWITRCVIVWVRVCIHSFREFFYLRTPVLCCVTLPQWEPFYDPCGQERDAHFLLPSGLPVLSQGRGAP